jgi:hypothetical protein
MAIEAGIALVVVPTGRALGGRSLAAISAVPAGVFIVLAAERVGSA